MAPSDPSSQASPESPPQSPQSPQSPESPQLPVTAPLAPAQGLEGIEEVPSGQSSKATSTLDSPPSEKQQGGADGVPAARTATARTGRSTIVPRSKRRGLLGQLTLVPEIDIPTEYSRGIKNLITIVVAAGGMGAPMASAILFPALEQITQQLHASPTTTNLSVALYMLAMAIFPLWWSAFAERSGRRTVYIISFTLYVASSVCAAVSVNIGMLIAFRIASGATAASLQAVGAGTIADIWEVRERGRAMGYFYLGPLMGPLLSPIIGGALTQGLGWRSTQWFLAIYGVCELLLMIFCLPETLRKKPPPTPPEVADEKNASGAPLGVTLTRVSTRTVKTAKSWARTTKAVIVDPLKALNYLRFPPVLLTVYWASFTFGCLYVLNVSIQQTYGAAPYNFSTVVVGCMYIPGSLGYVFASIVGGKWNDVIMRRRAEKRKSMAIEDGVLDEDAPLQYRPEDRMGVNAWVAGILYPLALLWYGWVAQEGVHWAAAIFAQFLFGVGSMLVFSMATTMLTEFVPGRSASAVAVNNFVRNIFSCIGGVVAQPIISAIGNGWLFTILCIVGLLSLSVPYIMHRWGPTWRARSHEYKFL